MTWGTRYLVIAIGDPQMPCTESDLETLHEMVSHLVRPLTVTKLSERTGNRLTVALISENMDGPS
jgi:hypothetical protein